MWWVKSYYYKLCRTQKVLSEYDICLAIRGICKALLPRCCQLLTRFFSYIFSDIISVLRSYLVECKLHLKYPIFSSSFIGQAFDSVYIMECEHSSLLRTIHHMIPLHEMSTNLQKLGRGRSSALQRLQPGYFDGYFRLF